MFPAGFSLFRQMLDAAAQTRMIDLARTLARQAPLITPVTRWGVPYKLQVTSWGDWGWYADQDSQRYLRTHPKTGKRWPPIPPEVRELMKTAAAEGGCRRFEPDTVLVNFYPETQEKSGSLGRHRDTTEKNLNAPIVTLSLGASASFGLGGLEYADPVEQIPLDGGDVLVMAGPARLMYHSVDHLLTNSPASSVQLKTGGRISFTARQYI
jgi:alkylated DNA repair protein (DNA oxidative demethylase)